MKWRNKSGAALLCGLMMVAASLAPAPRDDSKARQVALAKERIAVIRQALDVAEKLQQTGGSIGEEALTWSRRLVEATSQAGLPKADVVAAIQEARKQVKASEARAKAGFDRGTMNILGYLETRDTTLQIKIELEQVEAK